MNGSYRVNEIFYSLQGEGMWTGTPMVFVRLSGCNLQCPFCDTNHKEGSLMTAARIVEEALAAGGECRRICLTGGEPTLQADKTLLDAFHAAGFLVHLETNGTRPIPEGIDWVTLSPKEDFVPDGKVVISRADELKLVYTHEVDPERWLSFPAQWHLLQPCDSNGHMNMTETVAYIQAHPQWRLSLQTHKLLGVR